MHNDEVSNGLLNGFVEKNPDVLEDFSPKLLLNDKNRGLSVITSLKSELESCTEFSFSVAFISYDAINSLIQIFEHLETKGVHGRILASTYQNFTEPDALSKLIEFNNLEVRVITSDIAHMHSKCYIFRKDEVIDVIIGSSNLTNSALKSNMEWNLKISSVESGEVIETLLEEFDLAFVHATPVDEEWLAAYRRVYRPISSILNSPKPIEDNTGRPAPNSMQIEGIAALQKMHESGKTKALVVSATGTGKTYLAAFDVREYRNQHPNARFLYIVHRKMVLNKSLESFKHVIGDVPMTIFNRNDENTRKSNFVFSTIQSISKEDVLCTFDPYEFDYIIIDETHHAGAETYQNIIDYFKPKFLLGMTATPDTAGNKYDIYEIYDHNLAFNIRLKQAMEANLICPFHYFGVNTVEIDEKILKNREFGRIEFQQRVDHVVSKAKLYGYSGNRVKGLGFCKSIIEAQAYADAFRDRGFRTEFACGETDSETRVDLVRRLSSDCDDYLDYIFTADLFNEGVDIPPVNQILMLRPTDSPVVFIQQLGRGLRLYEGKGFVVIIDFIGNYANNYNIPIALSDNFSYRKDELRRFVFSGDSIIPGMSTISFDQISKERIYRSIDSGDFGKKELLSTEYFNLKKALGRIPELKEFNKFGSMDANNFLFKYKTYHKCLSYLDQEYKNTLSDREDRILEFATKMAASGKRILEPLLLMGILNGVSPLGYMISELKSLGTTATQEDVDCALRIANGSFYSNKNGVRKSDISLIEADGKNASKEVQNALKNETFRDHLRQVAELGILNWEARYRDSKCGLVLYCQYSREDVAKLLNWPITVNGQTIGGYYYNEETNTLPVFVNYRKTDKVSESQRYEDHFVNRKCLEVESKPKRNELSRDMQVIAHSGENNTRIELFMRKNASDAGSNEFYYLGRMRFERFIEHNEARNTMVYRYILDTDVPEDLYRYFTTALIDEEPYSRQTDVIRLY